VSELQALIFDVDGTLAETERDGHREAFNRAFADLGFEDRWGPELYGELLAVPGGKERMRHYFDDFVGKAVSDDTIAELHQRKGEHFGAMLREGAIPPRPGVRRLLDEARQTGIRLAIATTTSPDPLHHLLVHTIDPDAPQWFEVIVAGDEVPAKKPAPDAYDKALVDMGLAASDCLALEDSPPGVAAATAAGIPVVVTESDYNAGGDFTGAAAVFDGLGEPDEEPVRVLAGAVDLPEHGAVDLGVLRAIHARATP
jgi:HAD superfamily hydrolase (TIGR01509 family)